MKAYYFALLALPLASSCKTRTYDSDIKSDALAPSKVRLGLGLNDLSILLPRNSVKGLEEVLPSLTDENQGDGYIPKDALETVNATFKGQPVTLSASDYSAFKPSAIRFVPCANDREVGTKLDACVATLQIVWQMKADRSFHTIYAIPRPEFQLVVNQLVERHAKSEIDTESMPLNVHPIIEKEGPDGPYYRLVMELVKKHAKVSRMIGYATMQSDGFTFWSMAQFLVKDGASQLQLLPFENAKLQIFTDQAAKRRVLNNTPLAPISIPNLPFGDGGLFGPIPSPEKIKAAKDLRVKNSFLIDNPDLHNIRNMDCAGCHSAHFTIGDRPSNFQVPKNAYTSKHWNLANVSQTDSINMLALQMFSYERGSSGLPKITQRVINETAKALDYLVLLSYVKAPEGWEKIVPPSAVSLPVPSLLPKQGDVVSLVSKLSGKCLDLTNGGMTEGSAFQVWDCQPKNLNQTFVVEAVNDSNVVLKAQRSEQCLDLAEVPSTNGTALVQSPCSEKASQSFRFETFADGKFFTMKTNNGSRCVTIANDSKANGARIQTWDCLKKDNERWSFQKPL